LPTGIAVRDGVITGVKAQPAARSAAASENRVFQPIKGARAFEEVVDQITFAIRAGIFRVGDRLPTIDELARDMGTSRPTIGDAIEILSENRVLAVKRGATGGVVVASDDIPLALMKPPAGWREAALEELVEARRAIEMELALLAGERATEEDLATMREAVETMEREGSQQRGRPRWGYLDHLFHYAMGRAAHSEVLFYFQHLVMEQLRLHFKDYYAKQEDPAWVIATHRDTLAAIESRDRDRISATMNDHLAGAEKEVARRRSR